MYLTQSIKRAMQVAGNEIATIDGDRVNTWKECGERVMRLAGAARGMLGMGIGDRAAILALNSDRYFEFSHAMPWAGCVFVPINTRLAPPEITYWLNDSGSKVLFIDDAFLAALAQIKGDIPTVEKIVYIDQGETPDGMHRYDDIIANSDPLPDAGFGNNDLAAIYYTGGTTGVSKGVMLSHTNLVSNALQIIPAFGFTADMRWLHAGPMFHIADGLSIFGVTTLGGRHVFVPGFEPVAVMTAIQEHGITDGLWVPTMINMTVNHPDVAKYDLSSLRHLIYGASPMPEAVIRRALEVLPGCEFTHAYGMTETSPIQTFNPHSSHHGEGLEKELFKSCGRAAYGVELKVVDENDQEVPRNDVGELCARGANIMLGYWNKPEQTAAALRDGWMHTGDGAYMNDDGFVFIVDRIKDMIITGGENVYSAEVENAVILHPAVAECAVIGIPHEKWGEQVHAVVVLKAGEEADEKAIMEHCHQRIAGFKCPRSVTFQTESLPLSGAGKVLKTELRKPYWKGKTKQVN